VKARVLVTDGDERAALAVVRSLGRAGHEVHVASRGGRSLAGASRFARSDGGMPDALQDAAGFGATLHARCAELSIDVLLPIAEPALEAVLRAMHADGSRDAWPIVPFPDLAIYQDVVHKGRVWEAAREAGLDVPEQWTLQGSDDLDGVPGSAAALVVKPARSVSGGRKWGVSYADTRDELVEAVGALPAEAFPLLIQERIRGDGAGVFLLRWQGHTRAAFAHRRIREKPPSGGVSVLRESAALDPELQGRAEALLDALGWNGVAMVEFKIDERTGQAAVMEINPRFWGSLQLAIDAGVNFPRLLVEAALGSDAEPPPAYRSGVRTRWELGDLDHLLLRLRHNSARLRLPPGAPGRLATVAGFLLSFLPPTRQEILRPSDPRPFGREIARWLAQLR
jgi:predicted ATP-grasp superfamily ATP-dependent carboligase